VLFSIGRSGKQSGEHGGRRSCEPFAARDWHLAATCNPEGGLATSPLVNAILLDSRTNDQSLVMTSSFSNLLLAGLCVAMPERMTAVTADAAKSAQENLHASAKP